MATYTQNGINFNNVKTNGVEQGLWPFFLAGQTGPDDDGGIVNAVDIDWNEAVLPNGNPEDATDLTINTTGELLKVINDMQKQIYVLTAAVVTLAQSNSASA